MRREAGTDLEGKQESHYAAPPLQIPRAGFSGTPAAGSASRPHSPPLSSQFSLALLSAARACFPFLPLPCFTRIPTRAPSRGCATRTERQGRKRRRKRRGGYKLPRALLRVANPGSGGPGKTCPQRARVSTRSTRRRRREAAPGVSQSTRALADRRCQRVPCARPAQPARRRRRLVSRCRRRQREKLRGTPRGGGGAANAGALACLPMSSYQRPFIFYPERAGVACLKHVSLLTSYLGILPRMLRDCQYLPVRLLNKFTTSAISTMRNRWSWASHVMRRKNNRSSFGITEHGQRDG